MKGAITAPFLLESWLQVVEVDLMYQVVQDAVVELAVLAIAYKVAV